MSKGNEGRNYVVTGGASGIGRATVELLAEQGASVVAVDRDASALSWTDGVERVVAHSGDVTSDDTNSEMIAKCAESFGSVHGVFLNAGVPGAGLIDRISMDVFDRVMDVNVRAVAQGIAASLNELRKVDGGAIVVTGSTSGIGADPGGWTYNTSKAAVINMARAIALDVAHEGIRVNAVCPGPTKTGMTAFAQASEKAERGMRLAVPMARWGEASELAEAVAFLLSPAASFITGVALPVDGGIGANTGQFPTYAQRKRE